jgi:hypothetical protein
MDKMIKKDGQRGSYLSFKLQIQNAASKESRVAEPQSSLNSSSELKTCHPKLTSKKEQNKKLT